MYICKSKKKKKDEVCTEMKFYVSKNILHFFVEYKCFCFQLEDLEHLSKWLMDQNAN